MIEFVQFAHQLPDLGEATAVVNAFTLAAIGALGRVRGGILRGTCAACLLD